MNDLIERLRSAEFSTLEDVAQDAADEIEKLISKVSEITEELDQASSTCVMYKQQVLDLRDRISELSLELDQKDRRIKEMGGILISMAMEATE